MQSLIDKELVELNQRLNGQKIQIELTKPLIQKIINDGFDEKYGARPLKSTFNRYVTLPIAKKITSSKEQINGSYKLDIQGEEITIQPI